MRRHFLVYVDGRYVETIYTGWTVSRLMAQLIRKFPDSEIEIKRREE